ncbi:hypothetical protein EKO04_001798 [Ascochyta lentis]|uniref:Alb1-domain-containing protein n=1 Tax=Ascochyta lentis TaxID=205686 RepID=A0A8H7JC39_9PLEO|nr:hypothetical protein EKO04_001798 [Ascochyta lentis]
MAKTAKLKKKQVAPHSRAARRAASPSINLPKDLTTKTRDSHSPSRPSEAKHHVLSAQNAGISKKKGGNLKRAQRVRAQKAMERAADDMDKWELKRAKSITKAASIKERAKLWDDINGESTSRKKSAFATLAEGNETEASKKEREWVSDEDMDEAAAAAKEAAVQSEGKPAEAAAPVSAPAAPVQEDELL